MPKPTIEQLEAEREKTAAELSGEEVKAFRFEKKRAARQL